MPGEAWYDGSHSLTFSDGTKETSGKRKGYLKGYNTWDTWHLIPTSKPVVAGPQAKTSFIEIPGRDGAIDLSTYLTGDIVYGQRSGSWEFIIDNGWEFWETIRRSIYGALHGKHFYVVLEDEPSMFWDGRISVSDYKPDSSNNRVTIDYVFEPYCYSIRGEDWLWNTFNFDTDTIDGGYMGSL